MRLKYSPGLVFPIFILRKHNNSSWTRQFSYSIDDTGFSQFPHLKHREINFEDLFSIIASNNVNTFWYIKHNLKSESSMKILLYWFMFLGLKNLRLVCMRGLRYINIQYLVFLPLLGFWERQVYPLCSELFILVTSAFCHRLTVEETLVSKIMTAHCYKTCGNFV